MFNWKKDILEQPIETMFLLEERQLQYLAAGELRKDIALIFKAHPAIEWFMRNKAPTTNASVYFLFGDSSVVLLITVALFQNLFHQLSAHACC